MHDKQKPIMWNGYFILLKNINVTIVAVVLMLLILMLLIK